jgi:hypothetical protein
MSRGEYVHFPDTTCVYTYSGREKRAIIQIKHIGVIWKHEVPSPHD